MALKSHVFDVILIRRYKFITMRSEIFGFDPLTINSQDKLFFKRCQANVETTSRIDKTGVGSCRGWETLNIPRFFFVLKNAIPFNV